MKYSRRQFVAAAGSGIALTFSGGAAVLDAVPSSRSLPKPMTKENPRSSSMESPWSPNMQPEQRCGKP